MPEETEKGKPKSLSERFNEAGIKTVDIRKLFKLRASENKKVDISVIHVEDVEKALKKEN